MTSSAVPTLLDDVSSQGKPRYPQKDVTLKERLPLLSDADAGAVQEGKGRQEELKKEPVVVRIRHLGKTYPIEGTTERVIALKDIHLCEQEDSEVSTSPKNSSAPDSFGPIRRGEFVMIRGASGGGKTTLLNIIGTIDSCTEGSVELLGETIDSSTKEGHLADVRLRMLGFVFQTFNLISTMTAVENVELPMTLMNKLSDKQIRLRARQLLTLVGLRNRVNHLPSELSGGEQQRVTIARSLANNPAVLLLDEPTGDLDTLNTIDVMDLLVRINRNTKTTCIMVTHNPDVECYADRILYVSDGRFVKEVRNERPSRLDADAYAKYLEEKEREVTRITHWEGSDETVDDTTSRRQSTTEGSPPREEEVHPPTPARVLSVGGA